MKNFIIIIFLILLKTHIFSQNLEKPIDSLLKNILSIKSDSEKVVKINNYSESILNSKPELSKKIYTYLIKIGKERQFPLSTALGYNGMGLVFFYQGNYVLALNYFFKALEIAEKNKFNSILASTYNNVGLLYKETGQYDLAINTFIKSLKIKEKILDYESIANTLNNMGILYKRKKNIDSAIICYNNAKEIYEKLGNKKGLANIYTNLGIIEYNKGNIYKTINYMEKSLKLYEECNDQNKIAATLYNIGLIYSHAKNYDKANYYLDQCMEIASKMKDQNIIRNFYLAKSELYSSFNKYKQAYDALLKYVEINDSLMGENVKKSIAELQTKFQTAEKEKQITLLNKEKIQKELELEKQNSQIRFQKIIIISSISGLILILIFSISIYKLYKDKLKANKILHEQKEQIKLQNEELLKKNEEILTQRNAIENQNKELIRINKLIEIKNKNITDSIKYALRIQEAIFPPLSYREKILPNSFVFFKPKDIVSGDFYFVDECENLLYFGVVDCTGHGVPGAFMSIVGFTTLSQAIHEKNLRKPSEILDFLNYKVSTTLRQSEEPDSIKDGMELCLCCFDKNSMILEFSGARLPLIKINSKGSIEFRTDPITIGIKSDEPQNFKNFSLKLNQGDSIYLFSDGFADQFGGSERKKFQKKNLISLLKSIHELDVTKQYEIVAKTFDEWKGNNEQYDDVTIFGIKFN